VAANTTLAACAGALIAMFAVYPRLKKWDLGITCNGLLGGLVAITAPCYWVSPLGAIIIGGIGGIVVVLATELIEWMRIDDPIGAIPVHGFCGIWGTLSIGLFATGDFGVPGPSGADLSTGTVTGLFYGGGADQLVSQLIGSAFVTVVVLVVGLAMMYAVKATGTLRITEAEELEGIDLAEHGSPAYRIELGSGGYTLPPASEGVAAPAHTATKVDLT
jgi:Amt family ammonium transporter